MPQVSKLKLPPLEYGNETLGQRIARIRKERGYTQVELAQRIGIIQSIVSAIERDVLKLSAEMAVRFAQALDVTTDELIQPKARNGKNVRLGGQLSMMDEERFWWNLWHSHNQVFQFTILKVNFLVMKNVVSANHQ